MKNIIVFIEDINMIDISKFVFGLNELLIIPNINENRLLLDNINKIDYQEIFSKTYKDKVYLSEYDMCEYSTKFDKYIYTLPFIDTEKLSKIKYFLLENKGRTVDIIINKNISLLAIGRLKGANYITIDFSKYTKGEFNIYE
ncbi:MAG: hypothetical protein Q4G09_00830 [Clostridia bacterium]|nr:hypothetical protein [Clostridia bacterium]